MTPVLLIEWSMAIFIALLVIVGIAFSIKTVIELFRE